MWGLVWGNLFEPSGSWLEDMFHRGCLVLVRVHEHPSCSDRDGLDEE
jgi:hypothetical protein